MKIVTIRDYEMKCRTRWGWHTFRSGKNFDGKVIGFRFLGIGLSWKGENFVKIKRILSVINWNTFKFGWRYTGGVSGHGTIPRTSYRNKKTREIRIWFD